MRMRIDVLTLFPAMFAGPLDESIIKRAREAGLLDLRLHQLRDWAHDRHKTVDDRPFGGGPGMVMKADVLARALDTVPHDKRPLAIAEILDLVKEAQAAALARQRAAKAPTAAAL